jgi:hypothetical protein
MEKTGKNRSKDESDGERQVTMNQAETLRSARYHAYTCERVRVRPLNSAWREIPSGIITKTRRAARGKCPRLYQRYSPLIEQSSRSIGGDGASVRIAKELISRHLASLLCMGGRSTRGLALFENWLMRFFRCRGLTCEWQNAARGPVDRCERADVARVLLGKSDRDDFRNFAAEAKRGLGIWSSRNYLAALSTLRGDMKVHIRSSSLRRLHIRTSRSSVLGIRHVTC